MKEGNKYLNKTFVFPAVIGLVIVFVIFQFTIPQIGKIMEARAEIKVARLELDRLVQKSTALENLDELKLKAQFQSAQEALPSEKDVSGLLVALARLESEATVSSERLELSPGLISTPSSSATASGAPAAGGPAIAGGSGGGSAPSSVSLDYSISGEFLNIRSLLEKINQINPLLVIPDVSFSITGGQSLQADLKALFYYQPLPKTIGKVTDPLPVLTSKEEEILSKISQQPIYNQLPSYTPLEGGKINPFE